MDAAADAVYENALAARDAAGREREQVQALAYGVQALELGAERPDVGVDAELHPLRRVRDDEERLWLESGHLALRRLSRLQRFVAAVAAVSCSYQMQHSCGTPVRAHKAPSR